MRKLTNILLGLAAAALAFCACDSTSEEKYEPAAAQTGEQVYFPSSVGSTVKMSIGDDFFSLPISRIKTDEPLDVSISADGEGLDYFNVPGTVSFDAGAADAAIVVTVKDADALGQNNFYSLTLSVADEELTTPYARSSVTFTAGVELPWIKFDEGTWTDFWSEADYTRTLEYQQISETMRYCRVVGAFGDDEVTEDGEEGTAFYFYWNTETDNCYIPPMYLYTRSDGTSVYAGDAACFYIKYYGWDTGDNAIVIGEDSYFNWAAAWAARNNFAWPTYDGNGTFNLYTWYYIVGTDGVPTGSGWSFGGESDKFAGSSFGDYTLTAEYSGMLVDTDGEAVPIIDFTTTKKGAKYFSKVRYVITTQDANPEETLALIKAGESGDILEAELDGTSARVYPDIDPGLYTVVAVAYVPGDKEPVKSNFAVATDFYFPGVNAESKEVDITVATADVDQVYSQTVIDNYGLATYNSFAYQIKGTDIKSVTRYINTTDVIENGWDGTLEDLVSTYGNALSDNYVESVNGSGYVNAAMSLQSETSYTLLVLAENVYGSKKLVSATYTTSAVPYSGELVIGDYTINGSSSSNAIKLSATVTENKFIVYNLGVENNAGWNAVYDPDAHTLTLDGTESGYESYGNQFGTAYGYANSAKTYVYGIFVYGTADSKGDDPLVFSVDADSKKLSSINQKLTVEVYEYSDETVGDFVQNLAEFAAGSTVSYVESSSSAARKPARLERRLKAYNAEVTIPADYKWDIPSTGSSDDKAAISQSRQIRRAKSLVQYNATASR